MQDGRSDGKIIWRWNKGFFKSTTNLQDFEQSPISQFNEQRSLNNWQTSLNDEHWIPTSKAEFLPQVLNNKESGTLNSRLIGLRTESSPLSPAFFLSFFLCFFKKKHAEGFLLISYLLPHQMTTLLCVWGGRILKSGVKRPLAYGRANFSSCFISTFKVTNVFNVLQPIPDMNVIHRMPSLLRSSHQLLGFHLAKSSPQVKEKALKQQNM